MGATKKTFALAVFIWQLGAQPGRQHGLLEAVCSFEISLSHYYDRCLALAFGAVIINVQLIETCRGKHAEE
jgi:hypothetical protein